MRRDLHWTWALVILALMIFFLRDASSILKLTEQMQKIAHRLDLIEHAIGVQR